MKIKKICLKNIRSYENQEISFPEGSLLLAGDIGSGKTSVLMAIEYALFGLQPGQRGSSLLRNDKDESYVSLELETAGIPVTIERKLKKTNKSIGNEYASITIGGEKFESSVTEIKTKILELLKYPSEFLKKNNLLYRYTVYTPQESMKKIILDDPETRLNTLRHIFGIDKYRIIRENLEFFISSLKDESKSIQIEVKTLDEEKSKLEFYSNLLKNSLEKEMEKSQSLDKKRGLRTQIESELAGLDAKIKEGEVLEKELEKANIFVLTRKESLSGVKREIEELEKNLSAEENFEPEKLSSIINAISTIESDISSLNSKYIERTSQIKSLEQERTNRLSDKERIFRIDICPTCLQNVPEAHKHNILNASETFLVSTENKLKSLEIEKAEIFDLIQKSNLKKNSLEIEKTRLEILKSKIEYIKKTLLKVDELKKSKESLEKDISLLENHCFSLKNGILEFSSFNLQFKKKKDELRIALEEEKNSEIAIAEQKKEYEMLRREFDNLSESIKKKESLKKNLASIIELSDWLSGQFMALIEFTERSVLMKLRAEFASIFSKWFNILISSEGIQVQLDESFTPVIIQGDTEMEYSFLSGGERTAVALAYRLALNQTLNSLLSKIETRDILILDEPTEGFSEAQIMRIRDILPELNTSQIIIVSHEQKIESFVDHIIRIHKSGNISNVENSSENQIIFSP